MSMIPYARAVTPLRGALFGSRAARFAPYMLTRSQRTAGRAILGAYRNRKRIRSAARTIGRAWKKSRARRAAPGARQSARTNGEVINGETIPMRQIQVKNLKWPNSGTSSGQRIGPTIKLSGFRLCEQFHNDLEYPIVIHYALLQYRAQGTDTIQTDFFRDTTAVGDRSSNFVNAVAGGTTDDFPYEFKYDCYPINSNKFHVLMHMKRVLAAENTDIKWNWDTWKFQKWINMKGKKFTFDDDSDPNPTKSIFRVFWWQPLRIGDWGTGTDPVVVQNATISRQADQVLYFRSVV